MPEIQWTQITRKHPSLSEHIEEIKETLIKPDSITDSSPDESVRYYYKYYKKLKSPHKYLLVIVKYLNGKGFIITAYFDKNIK